MSPSASSSPSASPSDEDFWTREESIDDGEPVELHEFHERGTAQWWTYCEGAQDKVYQGHTFTAVYIEGGRIEQGTNALKSQTTIRVDWSNPFADQYKTGAPEHVIDYVRYRGHAGHWTTIFRGVVLGVVFIQESRHGKRYAEITADPGENDLRESTLVPLFGRQCQVELGSTSCGIDLADYTLYGSVTSTSGLEVISSVFATKTNGWFAGGKFVVGDRQRKIVQHAGNRIKLASLLPNLSAGNAFTATAGCDHLQECCLARFNNLNNFRGQPLIPDSNPFGEGGLRAQSGGGA